MNKLVYCIILLSTSTVWGLAPSRGKKTYRNSSRKLARRFAISHWGGLIYCLWQKCGKQLKPSSYSICHCQNGKPDESRKRRHNRKQNATQQPITCGRYCAGGCSSGASGTVMDGQWWQWKQSPHRKWMYICRIVFPQRNQEERPHQLTGTHKGTVWCEWQ